MCDGNSSAWWIKPECHSGLSGLEVAVAFQSALRQGHTYTRSPTLHLLPHIYTLSVYLPICLSIYLVTLLPMYSHTDVHLLSHKLTHIYTRSYMCTGFQALAAVIQDQFLPRKYSKSPGLLFIALQCCSVASARNACLALFRPFCNIHGAQLPRVAVSWGSVLSCLGWLPTRKHI